ncbi:MAG: hypothetical protein R3304_10255 [Longimicrobiales bacterium]|nr:hypothetical protein [Longimicrobiales bacterium]
MFRRRDATADRGGAHAEGGSEGSTLGRAHRSAISIWVLACTATGGLCGQTTGEEASAGVPQTTGGETEGDSTGLRSAPRGFVGGRLFFGFLSSRPDDALPALRGGALGGLGMTVFPEASRTLGLDFEYGMVSRSHPMDTGATTLLGFGEDVDELTLQSHIVRLGGRLQFPQGWAVRPYGGVGIGWSHHTMKVEGPLLLLPGDYSDRSAATWSVYWGGGIDARFGQWGASLDHRRFGSRGDFASPFDVSGVELGGSSWSFGGAWWPGRQDLPARPR